MFYDPVSGILWKVCFICLKQISRFYAYDLNIIVLRGFPYLFPSYDWKSIFQVKMLLQKITNKSVVFLSIIMLDPAMLPNAEEGIKMDDFGFDMY